MTRKSSDGLPILIRVASSAVNRALKKGFDLCAAIGGLIFFSPLFLIISLAIKLDSRGPVFIRQLRHSLNNEPVWLYKFRATSQRESSGVVSVTRVGRMLKRTGLEGLPQLLNVLAGEMSIVGPRPHLSAHNDLFEASIPPSSRANIKPGLVGWAQVQGFHRETATTDKMRLRIDCDRHYLDNWSLWFDLRIVFLALTSKQTLIYG